jgi:hypothetical protein
MKVPFLEYRSALAYNRDVFLIEHSNLLKTFLTIDSNFPALLELPRTRRDHNGKSHVSLPPFVLLLQRQAYAAFDVLSADQSYHAWLLLRPGIEAALIIGKWVDDPENAKIWQNKDQDPGSFQKVYTGKALRSTSLPDSERIQAALRSINDRFVHANVDYYQRHLDIFDQDPGYVNVLINYFEDDTLQVVNVFAILNLLLVVQEALLALFNKLFGTEVALPYSPLDFRTAHGDRIENLAQEKSQYRKLLSDLGAWR